MKLFKNRPKHRKGFSIVMHLDPYALEPVVWPATKTKPERTKMCHRILGYSYKKSKPFITHLSEYEIIRALDKEIRNGKAKK
jgi:hypothetical protein